LAATPPLMALLVAFSWMLSCTSYLPPHHHQKLPSPTRLFNPPSSLQAYVAVEFLSLISRDLDRLLSALFD
jgi:hypothetical protein